MGTSDSNSPDRGGGGRSAGVGATAGGTPASPAVGSGVGGALARSGRPAGEAPLVATGVAVMLAPPPDGLLDLAPSVDGGAGSPVGSMQEAPEVSSRTGSVSRLYGTSCEVSPEYAMRPSGGALKTTGVVLTGPNRRGGCMGPRACCSLVYLAQGWADKSDKFPQGPLAAVGLGGASPRGR